ncbi:hypothetical protein [Microbacterium trichothecenolyticum]|nr:hypothetical protein [Microbacterium trichothecenolyticum]
MREKVVLVAVCHRTLDATHKTFVSQQTIAAMVSASQDFVQKGLSTLERMGIIERHRRTGAGGYRTSDLIVVDPTYTAVSQVGREPTRPSTYLADSGDLTRSRPAPTQSTAVAEENIQRNIQMNTQYTPKPPAGDLNTIDGIDPFDEFWAAWPRKVAKPNARKAWAKALKRATAETITAAAIDYRDNPHRPSTEFIPHPATWLNRDGWDDALDGPRGTGRPTPTDRATAIARAGQQLIASRGGLAPVTTLRPKGLEG